MKRVCLIVVTLTLALLWSFTARAVDEETQLTTEAGQINQLTTEPSKSTEVNVRITAVFESWGAKEPSQSVTTARNLKMGYGETMIAGSLAAELYEKDPATYPTYDAAYQKVLDLRSKGNRTTGWGVVAKDLGVKLGPVVREMKSTGTFVGGRTDRFSSNYAKKEKQQVRERVQEKVRKQTQEKTQTRERLREKSCDKEQKGNQIRNEIENRVETGSPSVPRGGGHGRGR
ncbi:MAG: hypothetical protein QME44_06810 [Thermodesulfobacteriota bacterium]|nr:hypothetical protein [Thermodesulfobacteriota bacterium]